MGGTGVWNAGKGCAQGQGRIGGAALQGMRVPFIRDRNRRLAASSDRRMRWGWGVAPEGWPAAAG